MDASIFIFKIFRLPPVAQSSARHIQMKSSFKSNSWIMLYIYQYTLDDLIYVCPSLCPSVDAWLGKMVQSHNCSPLTPIIIKLLMSQGCVLVILGLMTELNVLYQVFLAIRQHVLTSDWLRHFSALGRRLKCTILIMRCQDKSIRPFHIFDFSETLNGI